MSIHFTDSAGVCLQPMQLYIYFSLQELVTQSERTQVYDRLSATSTSSPILLILPQLITPKEEVSLAAMCREFVLGISSVFRSRIKVWLVPGGRKKQKAVWPFSFTSKML